MRAVIHLQVSPRIPEEISALKDLSLDLWWTWNHQAIDLFRRIDEDLWEETNHNPFHLIGVVPPKRLEELKNDQSFVDHLRHVHESYKNYQKGETWFDRKFGKVSKPKFAYFSMEYGLMDSLRIYSGGLGVLAGDHLKSASDLGVPLVGVGLLYQRGYLSQYLNVDGWQQESYAVNEVAQLPLQPVLGEDGTPLVTKLQMLGAEVKIRTWRVSVGRLCLFLLDTNLPENPKEIRDITAKLYGGDLETRIRQEIILGIGGYRTLNAMGIRPVVCHMNEGHPAFLALERIRLLMKETDLDFHSARVACSGGNVFTTHTAVPAGFDLFPRNLVEKYFREYLREMNIDVERMMRLGRHKADKPEQPFNMAIFALRNTSNVNAVSRLHAKVSRKMIASGYAGIQEDEIPISNITNGVHFETWASADMKELLTRYLSSEWVEDTSSKDVWAAVGKIPDTELWLTHERRRERLVAFVRRQLFRQLKRRNATAEDLRMAGEVLNPRALTIGFARRFATYKRSTLILSDPDRLARMLTDTQRPVQIIFAGKAHPADDAAKELIRRIVHFARRPGLRDHIVFLEDFDLRMARYLVSGVDLWLNNPRRPNEASGTSGMKAVVNGGLNCSVQDGWWDEAYSPEVGWSIGAGEEYRDHQYQDQVEYNALYNLLEKEIIPVFYDRTRDGLPRSWIAMMKSSMKMLCPRFNTDRMLQQYTKRFYLEGEKNYRSLSENDFKGAKEYAAWRRRLRENWEGVRIDEVLTDGKDMLYAGQEVPVSAVVTLGSIKPDEVNVEIYGGVLDANHQFRHGVVSKMSVAKDLEMGRYLFEGVYSCAGVGRHGIGVRVTPFSQYCAFPHALPLIRWA